MVKHIAKDSFLALFLGLQTPHAETVEVRDPYAIVEVKDPYAIVEVKDPYKGGQELIFKHEQAEKIYLNCVISKSKGLAKIAWVAVNELCHKIAEQPSFWQKLKWGN